MDLAAAYREIENLIASYAECVDSGDFAAVGALLAGAAFTSGTGATVRGREAVEGMFSDTVITYDDGTPKTRHVTTNVTIDLEPDAGTAAARSYFTVLQATAHLSLRPVAAGRYHDRFARRDGRWEFTERRVHLDLAGDLTRHLRPRLPAQLGPLAADT